MPALTSQRRLRIAVLNRVFTPIGGGAERYSMALVEQLAQRHEVHVFAQQIDHNIPGVHSHVLPALCRRPRWLNQMWFAWVSWLQTRRGFDVVHSHELTWHGQVQTVHVLPVRFNLFRGRRSWGYALRWLKVLTSPRLSVYVALECLRYRYQPRRKVVVTSPSLHEVMATTFPAVVTMLETVMPGVERVPGAASADERRSAREQLQLPLQGRCLLFVGNDYHKKGLDTVLAALAGLEESSFVAVVGNQAHIGEYRQRATALGVAQRVHFLGAMNSVQPAYLAADCLLHPTLEDTFGMVVLEALAHGLPVLVSGPEHCGIAGLLTHQRNAWLMPHPRDAVALQDAIEQVLNNPATCQTLAQGAVDFAQQFLWAEQAARQDAIYQWAAQS